MFVFLFRYGGKEIKNNNIQKKNLGKTERKGCMRVTVHYIMIVV